MEDDNKMYPIFTLSRALGMYLFAVFCWFLIQYVGHQISPDSPFIIDVLVALIPWLLGGYYLNRLILHPLIESDDGLFANIHSQSSIKMACFVLWPIKYPELIVRIFFIRHV